jgi:glycosyltransferase involved in cell wall biosynthesis
VKLIEVVPAVSEEASGPSYSVVRLSEALALKGCSVTLAALEWGPTPAHRAFVKTFALGWGPRRLGRSPRMARWLHAEARNNRVDLLHNHSLWIMPNVYPGRTAKRYSVPYVVSPRGTLSEWAINSGSPIKRLFWPLVQRPSLTAVSCWHATSEAEYSDIRAQGFHQPIAVIPNGVDVPELPDKKPCEFRTLLFLGRIHPIKGVDLLLEAWQAVQKRFGDWRLIIAGPDNDGHLARMQRLARKLSVERVQFTGPLYGSQKWLAYRNSDLFILPTHSENFGLAVAEALAAGTPAIVTRGAPWEGLEPHRAGWWVETRVEALVATMQKALSLPAKELQLMGENGRRWIATDYSWPTLAGRMMDVYNWIVGRGPEPHSVRH